VFIGSPGTVGDRLIELAESAGLDEIMVTSLIYDHADRRHSYELLAKSFALVSPMAPAVHATHL
jgi:alkanesulfonate monooxygenase SsuD/methylene tetrahydromethanopterin reductase-like flavin-dependent oxidoreductase (luciferase family)